MNDTDIFRKYIVTEQELTVEVPSKANAKELIRQLRTAKNRHCEQMKLLGMSEVDNLATKRIAMDILDAATDAGTISVKIYVTSEPVRPASFEIKIIKVAATYDGQ